MCKENQTLELRLFFISSISTLNHKHIHLSGFTCWLHKLLIMPKLITTTHTLIYTAYFSCFFHAGAENCKDYDSCCCCCWWQGGESHISSSDCNILWLHCILVYFLILSVEVSICSSSTIAFPHVTVNAKWRVCKVALWLSCVTLDPQVYLLLRLCISCPAPLSPLV